MWRSTLVTCAALVGFACCRATVTEPKLAPAWSEELAAQPLSRAECVDLALHSAPNAAAWSARLKTARAQLESASRFANPVMSLGWEDFGLNRAASGSPIQTTLTLAAALEDVFSRRRRADAARYELDALEADVRGEMAQLAARVTRTYDELVVARKRVELSAELAAVSTRQRDDVRAFVTSGASARIDLERAEAERAEALAESARTEQAERALELEFAFALGFERPVHVQLAEVALEAGLVRSRDLTELLTLAAQDRQEILAASARYQAELERLHLAAERLQFLPAISAGPRRQGNETRGVASIDVALPLFDSGAAAQHEHEATLLAAAAAVRAGAHDVARDVYIALDRLTAAEAFLSDHARDLAARRRALRERTEQLFKAGEIEYSELALSRRDEVVARIALLDAELAVAAARIDLDEACGASRVSAPRH